MKKALYIILLLTVSLPALATDYYIRPDGNDANPGTSDALAWATTSPINNLDLNPGDRIFLKRGATYWGGIYFDGNDAGTAANPIIVTAYGTGPKPVIDATDLPFGFYIDNAGGIEFRNLRIIGKGLASQQASNGIFFYRAGQATRADHLRFDSLEIENFYGRGIMIGAVGAGYNNVTIEKSIVRGCGDGIFVYGDPDSTGESHSNFIIRQVTASNNHGVPTSEPPSGSGILMAGVNTGLIEHCVADSNGWNAPGNVAIWTYDSRNVTIQHNSARFNKSVVGSSDGGAYDLDGGSQNCILQYNYSEGNSGAGWLLWQFRAKRQHTGNIVRYNFSKNDGRRSGYGGLTVGQESHRTLLYVTNADVYNNTVVQGDGDITSENPTAVSVWDTTINVVVRNNNFYTHGTTPRLYWQTVTVDSSHIKFQNNNWYDAEGAPVFRVGANTYSSLAAWKSAAPTQERSGATQYSNTANPLFAATGTGADYFKLQNTSPLIDKGLVIANNGGKDYFGNTIPIGGAPEIGFHEIAVALVTPAAPTAGVVDDAANTFNWTNNPSFTALSDYEYTTNAGSTVATVTAKPINVGDNAYAAGQVGVRVKALNGNPASAWLFNSTAFTKAAVTPAAPTAPVTDDAANTFNWTFSSGYTNVSDYEYTLNGGTTIQQATAKPIQVGNINAAAGQVGVRVRAMNGNNASAWLYNTAAFSYTAPANSGTHFFMIIK